VSTTLEIQALSGFSNLDGLRLQLTFRNLGPDPVALPVPTDLSAALTVYAYRGTELTRVANGITHQDMMSRGRFDEATEREPVAAGLERSWELDLTSYAYPLLAGESSVFAECILGDGSVVRSNTIQVGVQALPVNRIALDRSNPVLDGVCVLLESVGTNGLERRLRLYNTARPLAPWFCEPLPALGADALVVATPNFFLPDTFDHFFARWLVAIDPGKVSALRLVSGRPSGQVREAPLPHGRRLLSAIQQPNDELLVFFLGPAGELECGDFSDAGLSLRFSLSPRTFTAPNLVIGGRADRLVIVTAEGGIERLDVDYQGTVLDHRRLFDTDLRTIDVRFDPVNDDVKASFWDGVQGQHLQLVLVRGGEPSVFYQERTESLRELLELSWDCDRAGEFHVVGNLPTGLFYWTRRVPPRLLLAGPGPRLPRVLAQRRPCIGLWDAERGYNFYEYRDGLRFREGPLP